MNLAQAMQSALRKPQEISFVIPRVPTSLNKMLRIHYRTRMLEQRVWDDEVFVAVPVQARANWRALSGESKPIPMQVEINVVWAKRRLDPDGLVGSLKPILDAMRKSGLIYNDSPKWLTLAPPRRTWLARPAGVRAPRLPCGRSTPGKPERALWRDPRVFQKQKVFSGERERRAKRRSGGLRDD